MKVKSTLVALAIGLLSMTAISSAHAEIINFDEISLSPGLSDPLTPNYQGFSWTNFSALNTSGGYWNNSGYVHASVSGDNVAFNRIGDPASFSSASTFTLNSFDLTAIWRDEMTVTVEGFLGNVNKFSVDLHPLATAATLVELDWAGIDKVTFAAHSGRRHESYETFDGTQFNTSDITNFAIDNITFNVSSVPEPESYAMLLAGLGALGFVGRRRRQVG